MENLVCITFVHVPNVLEIENQLIHNHQNKKKIWKYNHFYIINCKKKGGYISSLYIYAKYVGIQKLSLKINNWATLAWSLIKSSILQHLDPSLVKHDLCGRTFLYEKLIKFSQS